MTRPPLCACCIASRCPTWGGAVSRTDLVTCTVCGQACACKGCIVDEARLGQQPRAVAA